jgi:transposase
MRNLVMFPGFLILRLLILDLHLRLGRSESHYGMIAGNKYLRRTLFLCARVAKNYGSFKEFYNRLVERVRKLLLLLVLWQVSSQLKLITF